MTLIWILVGANIFLAFLDFYSTMKILDAGGKEMVWLTRTLMEAFGEGMGVILTKLLLALVLGILYFLRPEDFEFILAVAAVIQAGYVINNLIVARKMYLDWFR